MYTPFEILRRKINKKSLEDPFYISSCLNTLNNIEQHYLERYDVSDLSQRKDFINEFLLIDDFSIFSDIDKDYFIRININLLNEINILREKGFLYILRVWNLQPNLGVQNET